MKRVEKTKPDDNSGIATISMLVSLPVKTLRDWMHDFETPTISTKPEITARGSH